MIRSEPAPGIDQVTTHLRLGAAPEIVWTALMFYEDVPRRPWLLLRLFLPRPVRSEGNKQQVGCLVRCTYDRGHLIKRITAVEPARLLRFEVVEQHLGIESSVQTRDGSYQLRGIPGGTEVVLTTRYRGLLWPRFLWRPLERYLGRCLHHHILFGMRTALTTEALGAPTFGAGDRAGSSSAANR